MLDESNSNDKAVAAGLKTGTLKSRTKQPAQDDTQGRAGPAAGPFPNYVKTIAEKPKLISLLTPSGGLQGT